MATRDFETRLDDALTRLARGTNADEVMQAVPDAADLILTAHRLQVLATAPEPRLADGRRRFLAEGERLTNPYTRAHRRLVQSLSGFAMAFVALAILIMVAGSTLLIAALQIRSTPTTPPTQAATSTKTSLAPTETVSYAPTPAIGAGLAYTPKAVPLPEPALVRIPVLVCDSEEALSQCLKH